MPGRRAVGRTLDPDKFADPELTVDGSRRAVVELVELETLWFNTGSRCNIECRNCYVESGPSSDRLAFLAAAEVERFLDEIDGLGLSTREIGFTGGEPFVNREMLAMLEAALARGLEVLVLTNAMRPMMRPAVRAGLARLLAAHGEKLHLRVSLDHYDRVLHESERGPGSWRATLRGLHWLGANGFCLSVAGRRRWGEPESELRAGYARLFAAEELPLDAHDPARLVLFPEMDAGLDVPEITVDCWQALGVAPSQLMCARGRMVVRRKAAAAPVVVTCTLLPYDPRFEMGATLAESLGPVCLNHPHCARFCVLGGASCSVAR